MAPTSTRVTHTEADPGAVVAAVHDTGYAVVPAVLGAAEVQALASAVSALEVGHPLGRNPFEGERSHRLYSLITRGRPFEELAAHPLTTAVLDQLLLPNWLLSNCQSIRLYPGETHQPWHTDDGFYPVPRPHAAPLGISTIWALDGFTTANGATELLPGSHRWVDERPRPEPAGVVAAEMPPGSLLLFDAALWHRGGANTTSGTRLCMTVQYCQPWLRPQESQLLIAPPEIARGLPDAVRRMLGYSIYPPFIGQVEGKHPLRLVDEAEYKSHKGHDAAVADRVLTGGPRVSFDGTHDERDAPPDD
jgi:ectoine hydroxylase-related dioxygenase (phytanoyl-CoA dioxygenase family)